MSARSSGGKDCITVTSRSFEQRQTAARALAPSSRTPSSWNRRYSRVSALMVGSISSSSPRVWNRARVRSQTSSVEPRALSPAMTWIIAPPARHPVPVSVVTSPTARRTLVGTCSDWVK
ncbi:hypothetical protein D3C87_1825240 [compost metagenome]